MLHFSSRLTPLLVHYSRTKASRQLAVAWVHISVLDVTIVLDAVGVVGDGALSLGLGARFEVRIHHLAAIFEHIVKVDLPARPRR
jgi:hypothetical protein